MFNAWRRERGTLLDEGPASRIGFGFQDPRRTRCTSNLTQRLCTPTPLV